MERGRDEWIGRLPGGVEKDRKHHKKKVEAKFKICNQRNKIRSNFDSKKRDI